MLAVWNDDYEWYVARSAKQAKAYQIVCIGEDPYPGENEFEKISYWKIVGIYPDDDRLTKPRRLWAWIWILLNGPGFLASTEY